jgi:hypothetical protein
MNGVHRPNIGGDERRDGDAIQNDKHEQETLYQPPLWIVVDKDLRTGWYSSVNQNGST